MVDARLHFCGPDALFHDRPDFEDGAFAMVSRPPRKGWRHAVDPEWVTFLAPRALPQQGWKVHVSSTPDEAEEVLAVCAEYCLDAGLTFKFLKSPTCLVVRSSKHAERSGSGKFITIYPTDDQELTTLLTELGEALHGRSGPYILSDLRWQEGPLYLRYGAFVDRVLRGADGSLVHAIEDPEGRLVPDHRGPGFRPPDWAPRPAVVQQALEARQRGRMTGFPYRPVQALHFSNGGGVYHAVTPDGAPVLLKEARPHAGLDSSLTDAVARLERERWAHEQLAGMAEIPRLIDFRKGHEHYFLAREEIDGEDLQQLIYTRNPLLRAGATREDYADYACWAEQLLEQVEHGLVEMHRRGVVYADLHPANVLVRNDGSIRFIDFESARATDDHSPQAMAAPGYAAPRTHTSTAIDRYALGVLRMAIYLPLPSLLKWDTSKVDHFLTVIGDLFDVPADFEERVRRDLALPPQDRIALTAEGDGWHRTVTPSDWPAAGERADAHRWQRLADRLAEGVLASATPARADRLYPGDVQQFLHPDAALGLSHGAAGVIWALRTSGYEVPDGHRRWLLDRVSGRSWADPGLRDGLAGVALGLSELDEPELAEQLLDTAFGMLGRASDGVLDPVSAGVGLAAVRLAQGTGSSALLDRAAVLAAAPTSTTLDLRSGAPGRGLFGGRPAVAAFLLALHAAAPDDALPARAARLLRDDLDAAAATAPPSSTATATATATVPPLLENGAGGAAVVIDHLLASLDDPCLASARDRALAQTRVPFLVDGGLYTGRAGVLAARARLLRDPVPQDERAVQDRHLSSLGLHVVGLGSHLCAVAPLAVRLSCDLATGSAGVLVALTVAALGRPVDLPFLPPLRTPLLAAAAVA